MSLKEILEGDRIGEFTMHAFHTDDFRKAYNSHISTGIVINAPRQSGKTTFIIHKAVEEAIQGKIIDIVCYNQQQESLMVHLLRKHIKEIIIRELQQDIFDKINVKSRGYETLQRGMERRIQRRANITFVDECQVQDDCEVEPYKFKIGTDLEEDTPPILTDMVPHFYSSSTGFD